MMLVYCQSGTVLTPSDNGKRKYYNDTDSPVIINAAEIVDVELLSEKCPHKIIIRTSNRQYTFYKYIESFLDESMQEIIREMYVRLIQTLTDINDGILITAVPHPELLRTSSRGKIMTNCLWNPEPSQKVTT